MSSALSNKLEFYYSTSSTICKNSFTFVWLSFVAVLVQVSEENSRILVRSSHSALEEQACGMYFVKIQLVAFTNNF